MHIITYDNIKRIYINFKETNGFPFCTYKE